MRHLLPACALGAALLPLCALAQDHDHSHHTAEAEGVRVVHAWTQARPAEQEVLIFMEIENAGSADISLTGGTAMGQPLEVAGFSYAGGVERWTALPRLPIPAGGDITLAPREIALRAAALPESLNPGDDLEIELHLDAIHLHAHAEVGTADAAAHSHAGHDH